MGPFDRRPVEDKDQFLDDEVGLNHPESPAFVRLRDTGEVEIFADEGLGIVLDPKTRTITLVGDQVKVLTRNEKGFRWNHQYFNEKSSNFNEPTFVPVDDEALVHMFSGLDNYLVKQNSTFPNKKVVDPATLEEITYEQYYKLYKKLPKFGS